MKLFIKKSIIILTFMLSCLSVTNIVQPIEANAQAKIEIVNNQVYLNSGYKNQSQVFRHVINKYKNVITFFAGIAAITMVGIFIFTFMKLGATAGNPMERQKCITGLITTGIAAALLGSISLVVGIFYGALK